MSDVSSAPRTCCDDLQLDALLRDELDVDVATTLRAHLQQSPSCAARYAELESEQRAWLANMPPLAAPPTVATPSKQPAVVVDLAERRRRVAGGVGTLAAAAALVFALLPTPANDGGDVVRTKGSGLSASFSTSGHDLFDGDPIALPARVQVIVTSQHAGVVVVEQRLDDRTLRALSVPQPIAEAPLTIDVDLATIVSTPTSTASSTTVQVRRCADIERGIDCVVDAITLQVRE